MAGAAEAKITTSALSWAGLAKTGRSHGNHQNSEKDWGGLPAQANQDDLVLDQNYAIACETRGPQRDDGAGAFLAKKRGGIACMLSSLAAIALFCDQVTPPSNIPTTLHIWPQHEAKKTLYLSCASA